MATKLQALIDLRKREEDAIKEAKRNLSELPSICITSELRFDVREDGSCRITRRGQVMDITKEQFEALCAWCAELYSEVNDNAPS